MKMDPTVSHCMLAFALSIMASNTGALILPPSPLSSAMLGHQAMQLPASMVVPPIAHRDASGYLVQWMAARKPETLHALQKQQPVLARSKIARYQQHGQQWYILVDGPFSSQTQALATIDQASVDVTGLLLYPMTRSTHSLDKLQLSYIDDGAVQVSQQTVMPKPALARVAQEEQRRPQFAQPEAHKPVVAANMLSARPKNYIIEWMNSSDQTALEKFQTRYDALGQTQIVSYQVDGQLRYALVSESYSSRREAVGEMLKPVKLKMASRLSARVRKVESLPLALEYPDAEPAEQFIVTR